MSFLGFTFGAITGSVAGHEVDYSKGYQEGYREGEKDGYIRGLKEENGRLREDFRFAAETLADALSGKKGNKNRKNGKKDPLESDTDEE